MSWLPALRDAATGSNARWRGWSSSLAAGVLALGLAMPAMVSGAPPGQTMLADPPMAIEDFALTDQQGQPFRFSSLRGHPAFVFFGFSRCPDVCPLTMMELRTVREIAGGALDGAHVVMISVDGGRDSPADLKAFLAPLSPDFIGLTGDPRRVRDIAAQFTAVFVKGIHDRSGNYTVQHTSQVYLIDSDGRLRATFFNAPAGAMAKVAGQVLAGPP